MNYLALIALVLSGLILIAGCTSTRSGTEVPKDNAGSLKENVPNDQLEPQPSSSESFDQIASDEVNIGQMI